jgi:outer membrane protein assembly factor BamB
MHRTGSRKVTKFTKRTRRILYPGQSRLSPWWPLPAVESARIRTGGAFYNPLQRYIFAGSPGCHRWRGKGELHEWHEIKLTLMAGLVGEWKGSHFPGLNSDIPTANSRKFAYSHIMGKNFSFSVNPTWGLWEGLGCFARLGDGLGRVRGRAGFQAGLANAGSHRECGFPWRTANAHYPCLTSLRASLKAELAFRTPRRCASARIVLWLAGNFAIERVAMISRFAKTCVLGWWLLLPGGVGATADWPQWRGPTRDGHAGADTPTVASLAAEPKVTWRLSIGGGFSSPVVASGKLIYLDAENGQEVVHALDAQSGRELWRLAFATMFEDEWGPGPRSTPIIDGDRVYVQSCNGEFRCLNLADGKVIWGKSFDRDFGVRFLGGKQDQGVARRRGNNGCGEIDGDRLVVPVGAEHGGTLVCFDKLSGKVLWESGEDEAAYSSVMTATLAGVRQAVFFSAEALMGAELATGKLLWRVPLRTDAKRHAATPVIYGDTVTVNSHTIGLRCFKISRLGGDFTASELWADRNLKINLATPVLVGHYLYSEGALNDYVCVDVLTGKQMWRQEGFGENYASTIAIGENLLVQTDRGDLVLVAAEPTRYRELARAQVCGKTWSHPAWVEGKLYVREGLTQGWKLTCLDLLPP